MTDYYVIDKRALERNYSDPFLENARRFAAADEKWWLGAVLARAGAFRDEKATFPMSTFMVFSSKLGPYPHTREGRVPETFGIPDCLVTKLKVVESSDTDMPVTAPTPLCIYDGVMYILLP